MSIPAQLRREVELRADGYCEYCLLPQAGQEAKFHIDQIVPRAAGGPTTLDNLALACVSCSLRKGAKQFAIDPADGATVEIFHPLKHSWTDHFAWNGVRIEGKTPNGRATVLALSLNRELILQIRREERRLGRSPRSD